MSARWIRRASCCSRACRSLRWRAPRPSAISNQRSVVPRLLHEALRAGAHRLDGQLDVPPRGHHDDREVVVFGANLREHLKPLRAGGRIPRVVEVHPGTE